VQPEVARFARVCTYDRAGYGFSDAGPLPRTIDRIVLELHATLRGAGEPPPYIFAAHSFGGIVARTFASRYRNEIAGLVFVDSATEEYLYATATPSQLLDYVQSTQHDLHACYQFAATGWSRAPATQRHDCPAQMFRGLPERRFPEALNIFLWRQALQARTYAAVGSEINDFTADNLHRTLSERKDVGTVPILVLTAGHHERTPHAFEALWRLFARDLLSLSTNAHQTIIPNSGHDIELDRPDLVTAAIRSEVTFWRRERMHATQKP
jgi:pimeloyl-ACP methyl ester carboxylesterase